MLGRGRDGSEKVLLVFQGDDGDTPGFRIGHVNMGVARSVGRNDFEPRACTDLFSSAEKAYPLKQNNNKTATTDNLETYTFIIPLLSYILLLPKLLLYLK